MGQALKQVEFTKEQIEEAREAFNDFPLFCEKYLKIGTLGGDIIPFVLNRPQRRFIAAIMKQWEDVGYIKVVIAKARKMGFSTVITAFIFWVIVTNITKKDARKAIAGTHSDASNPVLLGMFKLFYEHYPDKLKPTKGTDNASVLEFPNINSQYEVKVASNVKKVGRGPTSQMLHISEIAHIDNASELAASLLSVVGNNVPDSMVFLESTANGMGNYHHNLFIKAEAKMPGCKFISFFAPWFEDERYVEECPADFTLTLEEKTIAKRFGLTNEQMNWRRTMIATFDGTEKQALALFNQEYPDESRNAFAYSATESFIEADLVLEAMNRPQYRSYGAIIAGYDPSFKGKDRDAFIYRQGANMWGLETPVFGEDLDARVRFLKDKLDSKTIPIDMLFIDAGGGGYNIISRLKSDGYGKRVRYIEFGAGADNSIKYQYKRDEMFGDFVDLLIDKHMPLAIDVGDMKDAFLQDLTATGYKNDHKGRPKMESKESMKARGIPSTDLTDAAILTVAQKIVREHVARRTQPATANSKTPVFHSLKKRRRR
jgi:hypothetical protein